MTKFGSLFFHYILRVQVFEYTHHLVLCNRNKLHMTGCILPAFSGGGRELSPTALAPLNPLSGWLNDNCQGKPWFKKTQKKTEQLC